MNKKIKAKLRGLWRSRMALFGIALSVLSGVQPQLMDWLKYQLTAEDYALAGVVIGTAIVLLRWVTTKPLEEK